jgi:WhiB family redox-sensing transcriptional regulator
MMPATTIQAGLGGWAARGACRHSEPELFFPVTDTGPAATQLARAKAVCAGCPVRAECLEFALSSGQAAGVWGGTTQDERRLIRRRQRGRRQKPRAA